MTTQYHIKVHEGLEITHTRIEDKNGIQKYNDVSLYHKEGDYWELLPEYNDLHHKAIIALHNYFVKNGIV